MLLQNILSGTETSSLVLIHDTVRVSGRDLISRFVQSLLERVDLVVLVLFDLPPSKFLGFVDKELHSRIQCFDGFTDPLHWDAERNHHGYIYRDSSIVECVKSGISSVGSSSSEQTKVAVVIDSVSKLLLWHPMLTVSRSLQRLSSLNSPGFHVIQVVGLLHSDVHDQYTIDCVNSLASTVISTSECPSSAGNSDTISSCCKILHKRKTGKVLRKEQKYSQTKKGSLLFDSPERDWTMNSQGNLPKLEKEVDPTSNLSFNLKLSEVDRNARAKLSLPYMFHDKPSNAAQANIFYQPDDADDFDEDDPDNDLDI